MSTGRRKLGSDGPSKGSSRGRKKASSDNQQLITGVIIGGGIMAFASLFFFFGKNDSLPAPAPVAIGPPAAPAPIASPVAVPAPVAAPAAIVAAAPAPSSAPGVSGFPVAGTPTPLTPADVQKTSITNVASTPMETASAPTAKLIPKVSVEERKELTMPALIEQVDPAIVRLSCKTVSGGATGSGFLVDDQGTVVTNYHVVSGSRSIEAQFENGDKVAAEGFYILDQQRDIAILKIAKPAGNHAPVRLAKDLPKKGTPVVAFGCPQGLDFSTTQGIVSGIRKPEFVKERLGNGATMIQTDTPISSGNSGGPLVDMTGEVVAMNTMGLVAGQNLNFSVSSIDIAEVLAKKGNTVKPISPDAMPEEDTLTGFLAKFDDLSTTERGRHLLGQVEEVVLSVWAFPLDPTDRLNSYCMNHLSKAVEDKLKLKVRGRRGTSTSTPLVVCAFAWTLPKDFVRNGDIASNLELRVMVIARDVDKEGNEVIALVYKDQAVVGTLSLGALADGRITKAMETNVPKFFDKFVSAVRKAKREAAGGSK